ncbi:MAG TPA: 2,3-bisphosphoglycerate-independent phosphoglycerate mutase [Candidatus Kapabacteria bacterium]|nr:2,3-bisphosphoglycerate-independent phosphoglycerate mutase [Candidatus Kapabacteria bacterium]HPP39064.1 2,3-bisphosphoglycerate-independent phosphoglycerate mutase [Candidatus Kapabacteria bacterium]
MRKKVLLTILDGWGIGDGSQSDVISVANTPYWDKLIATYPNSKLLTCGENVGLPDGQMGNSEVGHLNIGAGRIVYQDLVKINKEIREGKIDKNPVLVEAFKYAKENNKAVHFLGLVSDGGVHSLDKHLYKLCDLTKDYGLERVFIHALTDGRDTDPRSGYGYIKNLLEHLENSNGKIASLCGRYYTMDRDKRWERIKQGYDLITKGIGKPTTDILKAIQESYDEGVTDEFIKPIVCTDDSGNPIGVVQEGDVFICFNFRTDRLREITIALTQKDMHEFDMHTIDLYYLTMTRYDDTFQNVRVIYDKENVSNTLGEVISKAGLRQLRIAETEKYAHVTFFFSGGREEVFENEDRILIHSPKVPTYDMKPEMSAFEVKDALVEQLNTQKYDFICLNFANGDMVGHTGVYDAIRKAVEAVDACLAEVVETARKNDYTVLILADHGNADYAKNPDGSPNTAHSLNPVPFVVVSDEYKTAKDGILADVAPTVLSIMGLAIPEEMTGKILIE